MKSDADANARNGSQRQWRLGDFIVDEQLRTVSGAAGAQTLTDLTWRLLLSLIEAAPGSLSAQDLAQQVWRSTHVSNEALAQRVRQLRQVFGDDVRAPTYIRTLRGNGYQLIPQPQILEKTTGPMKRFVIPALVVAILAAIAVFLMPRPAPEVALSPSEVLSSRADEYREHVKSDSNAIAIELYREALTADPGNVDALVGLSLALANAVSKFGMDIAYANEATALADQAIGLQPKNSGALAAKGFAHDVQGQISEAVKYYRAALKADPENRNARASLAYLLQIRGELHEGLKLDALAYTVEPSAYFTELQISSALYLANLPDLAARWLDKAKTMRPDNVFLADVRARRLYIDGEAVKALQLLQNSPSQRSDRIALLGTLQWALGLDEAKTSFDRAQALAGESGFVCYACLTFQIRDEMADLAPSSGLAASNSQWPESQVDLAALLLAKGRSDNALDALDRAVELGYRDWRWLESHPFLVELRAVPRFKAVVDTIRRRIDIEQRKILSDLSLAIIVQGPATS